MTPISVIEAAIVSAFSGVPGLKKVFDYQPEDLGSRLPALTLEFVAVRVDDRETGICQDIQYEWRATLYINLQEYREAQATMKTLLPLILSVQRDDPSFGRTCEWSDWGPDEDPIYSPDLGHFRKTLRLRGYLTE